MPNTQTMVITELSFDEIDFVQGGDAAYNAGKAVGTFIKVHPEVVLLALVLLL